MKAMGFKQFLRDGFSFQPVSSASSFVIYRNFLAARRSWLSFAVSLWGETVLLLIAFGYGVGALIDEVQGRSYLQYLMPGLLMSSSMWVAFFESSLAGRSRLLENRTYQSLRSSPILAQDIFYGELTWATLKGTLAASLLIFIGLLIDVWSLQVIPGLLLLVLLNSLIFSSLGFLMMTSVSNVTSALNLQVAIILPMYLFSGILFPSDALSSGLAGFFDSLPLSIAVRVTRDLAYGEGALVTLIWTLWLLVIGFILLNLAVARLRRLWIT